MIASKDSDPAERGAEGGLPDQAGAVGPDVRPPPGIGDQESGENTAPGEPGASTLATEPPAARPGMAGAQGRDSDPVVTLFTGAVFEQALGTPWYSSRANGFTKVLARSVSSAPWPPIPATGHRDIQRRAAVGLHGVIGNPAPLTGMGHGRRARPLSDVVEPGPDVK